jgi:hypothetical protein
MSDLLSIASTCYTACCVEAPRYRVAWLVGVPQRSRKTLLARQLCEVHGWQYLDYTLTPGYFDALTDAIGRYQPVEFVAAIRNWCAECNAPVLVLDEIDAVLATWDRTQRRAWAGLVARLQYLPCGLVLVSHFFNRSELAEYLPDRNPRYCFDLSGDAL